MNMSNKDRIAQKIKELAELIADENGFFLSDSMKDIHVHDAIEHPSHTCEIDEDIMTIRIDLKKL